MTGRRRVLAFSVSVAAWAGGALAATTQTSDPIEPVNRGVYSFNKHVIDRLLLTPLVKLHNRALPRPARVSIGHFLANLDEPKTAENDILQGRFVHAGTSVGRFIINSTIGIAGLLDVAETLGLRRQDEDFGQTLGSYGVGGGPYVVLPVLGSTNLRDLTGKVVDTFMDPLGFINLPGSDVYWTVGRKSVTVVEERAHDVRRKLGTQEASADPYAADRDRYAQEREVAIANEPEPAETPGMPASPMQTASIASGFHVVDQRQTGDDFVITVRTEGLQPLPCDQLWQRVSIPNMAGLQTVTVQTAPPGPQMKCTKFVEPSPGPSIPAESAPVPNPPVAPPSPPAPKTVPGPTGPTT